MDISEIIPACLVDEKGRDLLKHANSFGKGLDKFALLTLERYLESAIDFNEAYDLLTESYTNPGKYLQAIAKKLLLWLVVLAAIIYALWISGFAYHGDARTQNKLGLMYDNAWGVTQDYSRAHMWYSLAIARGLNIAEKNRDLLAKKMTPAQIAKAQKLAREWKPKGK